MQDDTRFPSVPHELVEALDALFPLRSPDPDQPDRQIWIEVGQRRVIEFLRATRKRQQDDALNLNPEGS